ncbi:hypothetical protein FGIG_10944, partial [Fasciola gigantica]
RITAFLSLKNYLFRRGVDLNKIAQLAPKALPTSPISPPPSSSGFQDRQFLFHGSVARTPHVEPTVSRGRSFRTIKTKSIRLLEEQLASGQSPNSVIQTKQHYQGARGLPASGTPSTYMRAYGQNPSLGYLGRTTAGPGSINDPAWTGRETAIPIHSAQYARSVITPNDSSYVNDSGATPLDQSEHDATGLGNAIVFRSNIRMDYASHNLSTTTTAIFPTSSSEYEFSTGRSLSEPKLFSGFCLFGFHQYKCPNTWSTSMAWSILVCYRAFDTFQHTQLNATQSTQPIIQT